MIIIIKNRELSDNPGTFCSIGDFSKKNGVSLTVFEKDKREGESADQMTDRD